MSPLKSGFGEQIQFGSLGSGQGSVPSTAIGGLSSRQVVFGSPSGGIQQSQFLQFDTTNGGLGIQTSAPNSPLTAGAVSDGVGRIGMNIVSTLGGFIGFTAAAVRDWAIGTDTAAGSFKISRDRAPGNAGTDVVVVNSSGHVGIGTTAPLYNLDVHNAAADSDPVARFTGGVNPRIDIESSVGGQFTVQALDNDIARLGTLTTQGVGVLIGGSERARFNSSGHFGIGTTAPTVPLHVDQGVRLMSTGANVTFSAFGVAGTTQASSYTTGSASTGRTLPSTITTVAGLMSAAERENFNRVAQTLETLVKKDLLGYGWTR